MLHYAPKRLLNPLYFIEPTMPYMMLALLRLRRLFSSFPPPLSLHVYLRRERTAHAHESARHPTQNRKRKKGTTHSSYVLATAYATATSPVSTSPAGFPLHSAVPRKLSVLPWYMGAAVTLNGKLVTGASIRIPK